MHHSRFVHLHLHTYYSLLDGAIPIDLLAKHAKNLKFPAIAITDHGNLFGAMEFYETMMNAGIKPIIGCEMYLLPDGSRLDNKSSQTSLRHLTLLVKNRVGYKNLCKLISTSYLDGFYYKPRIDKEILRECSDGIVAMSGCLRGEIPNLILSGQVELAKKALDGMLSIFGDNFYLELQDHGINGQKEVNNTLIEIGKEKGVKYLATNDAHYLNAEDAKAQDALLCIQTGNMIADTNRIKLESDQLYLKSEEEMRQLFSEYPEACDETWNLAEKLNFEFEFGKYHFPNFEPPKDKDLSTYLRELSENGLLLRWPIIEKLYPNATKIEYENRLNTELKIICDMGFAGYFLIVADFIKYAKSKKLPVGPGRGSAAGSLVAYCLEITNIDPIANSLLFERFLNPERISMPDMDIDFCMRRRDEIIEYVAKKYGNVSQIITFGKMKARAVVRDVGRVLGMAYGDVDRIAKLIPATLNITLERALKIEPKLKNEEKSSPQVKELLTLAKSLEGFPRHASTHAAGVVISDKPLTEFLPLYRGQKDEVVTQFDMKAVEKIGLIKFDFLGLKTLTVIDDCIKLIKLKSGEEINIEALPLNDKLVFEKLATGDTSGIFQLESSGMTALVTKLKPTVFSDLTALVALFRPGPLGSGMVDDFINRKHGRIPIKYDLPQLESILKDTYGVILYQEQVMQIASKLANFTLGDADILRRAMGKKKPEEMEKQKEKFIKGCVANNVLKPKAERMFDLMANFAEYGFNKSHSAAYALVAYQTAYLKYHYPIEYMASLLTSESTNTDKLIEYISDCKEHNIKVLPPDVNESGIVFTPTQNNEIRFGLTAVKNVGESAVEHIIDVRKDGLFKSVFDFCKRVDSRRVNKRVIESLVKSGAFDFMNKTRASIFGVLEKAMEIGSICQKDMLSGQASLFCLESEHSIDENTVPDISEWTEQEKLQNEKDSLGFYISGHPLAQYETLLKTYSTVSVSKIIEVEDKSEVRFGGIPSKVKEITTRKGDRMGFLTIEDIKGQVEVIVFSDIYKDTKPLIDGGKPLFIVGQADVSDESAKVIAKNIWLLTETPEKLTKSIHFHLHISESSTHQLQQLKSIIARFPGTCSCYLHIHEENEKVTIMALPPDLTIKPSSQMVTLVEKLFGHPVVKFQF